MGESLNDAFYSARDTEIPPVGSPDWAKYWEATLQEKPGAVVVSEEKVEAEDLGDQDG